MVPARRERLGPPVALDRFAIAPELEQRHAGVVARPGVERISRRGAPEVVECGLAIPALGGGGTARHRVGRGLELDPVAHEQEPHATPRCGEIRELPRYVVDLDDDAAQRLTGPHDRHLTPPPCGLAAPAS